MRRPDWLARLQAEVAAAEARPFEWGVHDCCLFAARCADAQLEQSWLEMGLRLQYHDKPSALRFIAREGGIIAAISARLGNPYRWPAAARGDLCRMPSADGLGSVGVCLGASVACVGVDGGLTYWPTDRASEIWKVQ